MLKKYFKNLKLFFLSIILSASFSLFVFIFCRNYFQPVAIIVPHHDIVKAKRFEFLQQIAKKRPVTKSIIIIGPDHFSPKQTKIIYSNKDWPVGYKTVNFENKYESLLNTDLSLENGTAAFDHAIYNLLPDIEKVWPDSKVFPILIGQKCNVRRVEELAIKISQICKNECLLISSVDFSHYLPSTLANIHDTKSIDELASQNLREILKLEVDSPQSLFILSEYSKQKKAKKWQTFFHSNSGEIAKNRDIETTSHVMGYYTRTPILSKPKKNETFIYIGGLDRKENVNSLGERLFYGVDSINSSSIDVKPFMEDNLIIAGYKTPKHTQLIFLPTEIKEGRTYLLRGEAKTKKLIDIFQRQKLNQYKSDVYNGIILF